MSSVDAEDLISRVSGGLAPADRASFHKAAETALATLPNARAKAPPIASSRGCGVPTSDTSDSGRYEKPQNIATT